MNATNANKPGAPPVDRAAARRMMLTQAKATLESAEGVHDLYFVFKNPKASANQIIMQIQEIQFQNEILKSK